VPYIFMVLTVKFFGGWIIINSFVRFKEFLKNITLLSSRRAIVKTLKGVNYRDLLISYATVLPSR
jgi:hypothetical protein